MLTVVVKTLTYLVQDEMPSETLQCKAEPYTRKQVMVVLFSEEYQTSPFCRAEVPTPPSVPLTPYPILPFNTTLPCLSKDPTDLAGPTSVPITPCPTPEGSHSLPYPALLPYPCLNRRTPYRPCRPYSLLSYPTLRYPTPPYSRRRHV